MIEYCINSQIINTDELDNEKILKNDKTYYNNTYELSDSEN